MYTAAILAGGQARRMGGQPKALLPIGGSRIIDHQLMAVREIADHVAIVANDHALYESLGVPIWPDIRPGCGPLGGILTALVHATTPITLVLAGDMPFITVRFLQYLADSGRDVDVAIPRTTEGYQPLCAAYNQRCIEVIQKHLDTRTNKVTDFLPAVTVRELGPTDTASFDPAGTLFFNVNSPNDYETALKLCPETRRPSSAQ